MTKHITAERLLEYVISQDINQWLHEKGDDVHKYQTYLDRVCDISDVIRGSLKKIKELEGNEDGKCVRVEGEGHNVP